ncbi:N-acetyltransferase [Stenotrophomonas sp. HITSZ_GD]|uniref:GNAT family N-acetyltransferase n=1 Tax=Stenotrophomonas sp. HITSZ_GD TaxID=3037248 RepID=UPI00240DE6EC|nr:N-acetyltransferase [Stenotrophomonas sp. HITSZ_GD]MDG2526144.1 N-acetyltransferase [Stenotrophomonas sp. HITSZ_GD]
MWIREENASDHAAIARVVDAAFAAAEHAGSHEARIVAALRADGALRVSRVADIDGRIAGYVALSPVRLDDGSTGWFGLGPVAVDPADQGRGVGSALVRAALAELPALGARGCVVLGEPGWYARFGFRPVASLRLDGAPASHFQALLIGDGDAPHARVHYSPAFFIA